MSKRATSIKNEKIKSTKFTITVAIGIIILGKYTFVNIALLEIKLSLTELKELEKKFQKTNPENVNNA